MSLGSSEKTRARRMREIVCHDLKNPVSAAWTTAAFMAEMADSSDDLTRRNLRTIGSALTRALAWIDDFGLVVQLETGDVEATPSVQEADTLISQVMDGLPEQLTERVEVRHWEGSMVADGELIQRAVRGMLQQADDRVSGAAPLTISLDRGTHEVRITCIDRGRAPADWWQDEGIPSLGDPLPPGAPSPPLSLVLCKAVARSHGGAVTVSHSGGENRVTLSVPVEPGNPGTVAAA